MEPGTGVELNIFPEWRPDRVIGRQTFAFPVCMHRSNNLTIKFPPEFVRPTYIGRQRYFQLFVAFCQNGVGFSHLFKTRASRQIKAQFQVKDCANRVW